MSGCLQARMDQTEGKRFFLFYFVDLIIKDGRCKTDLCHGTFTHFFKILSTALPTLSSNPRLMPRRCWRRPRELTCRDGPSWSTLSERKARKGASLQVNSTPL